jgi:hypothetical protein
LAVDVELRVMEAELAQVGGEDRVEGVFAELALAGVVLSIGGDWRGEGVLDVGGVGAHTEQQPVVEEGLAKG